MDDEKKVIEGRMQIAGIVGPIWIMGWLFTIGFAHLPFLKGLWALVLWPYYLGCALG